jgi:hypothetical protein
VSKVSTLLRRHAVSFAALFLLLGSAAYAAAGPAGTGAAPKTPKKIHACVAGDHRTLNLTTAKRTCPKGQTKISWNPGGRRGARGLTGLTGLTGQAGARGAGGPDGPKGANGATGPQGAVGPAGTKGNDSSAGPPGPAGPKGNDGSAGSPGPAGLGGIAQFAEFFALMPPDNAATVAPGTDVDFPQDGPTSNDIARTDPGTFNLPDPGTYRIAFSVSVTEAGQLILTLNGADLAYTVTGRATGTSQITGESFVQTTTANSLLTVRNPEGNSNALTITPVAGGARPVSATLTIEQLRAAP